MLELNESVLGAFHDELTKEASKWYGRLGSMGGGAGMGAGAGALVGAAVGGVKKYREAKREGDGTAGALSAALGGGLSGGISGAGLGALAGGAGGALNPEMVAKLEGSKALGALSRFGKRQTHAVTGWTPVKGDPHSIESIGAGAASARSRLDKAREAFDSADVGSKATAGKALMRASKGHLAAHKAQGMGLTSIPGYASAIKEHGIGETLRTGWNEQWKGMSAGEKALMLGLPAAGTAAAIASPEDPNNPHRGRAVGAGIANAALGAVTGGIPMFAGGAILGTAATGLGGAAGGAIDRLRRKKPPTPQVQAPPNPETAQGQHVPTEHVLSPAAAGQPPESV